MSHWAEIDQNNVVLRVLVGNNDEPDEGLGFVESLGGKWIQTSYNGNMRFNYAGIGYIYDEGRDAFIAPKVNCHDEEILDEATCRWSCNNAAHII